MIPTIKLVTLIATIVSSNGVASAIEAQFFGVDKSQNEVNYALMQCSYVKARMEASGNAPGLQATYACVVER